MKTTPTCRQRGFTLVELMIVVVIFGIIAGAVVSSYQSQQVSYLHQEKLVEVQQNTRAAMFFLERDIRMFGYDPSERAHAGTNTNMIAHRAELQFAWDMNEDGSIQTATELVHYELSKPLNSSGFVANTDFPCNLERAGQPVVENVQAMELRYHLQDGTTRITCTQTEAESIASIDVSLLLRSAQIMRGYRDTATYTTAGGTVLGPFNDAYIRRMMVTNIKCRNMGLGS